MAIPINEAKDLINDGASGNGNVEGSTSTSTQGNASISPVTSPVSALQSATSTPTATLITNLIPTALMCRMWGSGSPAERRACRWPISWSR